MFLITSCGKSELGKPRKSVLDADITISCHGHPFRVSDTLTKKAFLKSIVEETKILLIGPDNTDGFHLQSLSCGSRAWSKSISMRFNCEDRRSHHWFHGSCKLGPLALDVRDFREENGPPRCGAYESVSTDLRLSARSGAAVPETNRKEPLSLKA